MIFEYMKLIYFNTERELCVMDVRGWGSINVMDVRGEGALITKVKGVEH